MFEINAFAREEKRPLFLCFVLLGSCWLIFLFLKKHPLWRNIKRLIRRNFLINKVRRCISFAFDSAWVLEKRVQQA